MYLIRWTNKYSQETGYVASISNTEKCFHNTYKKEEAKAYKTAAVANRMITKLCSFGEADNNDFEVVPA